MAWIDDIKSAVIRRIPQLETQSDLIEDLIDDAFRYIVNYSHDDSYSTQYDKVLVRAVAMLFNNIGVEGSMSRNANGISDSYNSTDVLASFVASNVKQYIRPSGYEFSSTRYTYPE